VDKRLSGINRPKPTRCDQPSAQAPRRSAPRWDNRRSAPEPALDNRRRQRTPFPVDRRPSHDDKKLLGFVAGALELIQERVLRGTEATVVLKQTCLYACTGGVTHVRAILHHYCAGGSNSWLTNHTIPQGRPLAGSVFKS
jgi:hypothetical protein